MNEQIAYVAAWLVMMCMFGILLYRAYKILCNRITATEYKHDWMPLLLTLVLIAARWPTWFYEYEINPDESWLIAGALRLYIDAVPWRSVDLTTSGPLNSFILLLPYAISSQITYGAEHMIATGLVAISLICWYWSIKLLRGHQFAVALITPVLFFFVFAQSPDFFHYSTELLSITLISVAVLVSIYPGKGSSFPPFLAGLLLGCVPFAKIQAAPLAVLMFAILYLRENNLTRKLVNRKGVALVIGGATVPVIFAITLLATDSLHDAWRSYILSNLSLSNRPMGLTTFIRYVIRTDYVLDIVLVTLMMIALAGRFSYLARQPLFNSRSLELLGGFTYLVVTIFVIWKAGNPWGHYLLFLLPGTVYLATIISNKNAFEQRLSNTCSWLKELAAPHNKLAGMAVLLTFAIACVQIRPAALQCGPWYQTEQQQQGVTFVSDIINAFLDNNKRLAVWGYMPQYYVLTSAAPVTRDVITQMQVWDNPQISYYRQRYLSDLMRNPPDVIVDASGKGNFSFIYHPLAPITEFPELHAYVSSHYRLLVNLAPCATPGTRIYLSLRRAENLNLPKQEAGDTAICIRNQGDIVRLLASIKNGVINDEPR